jgi:LuxR family transcriptional regulator, maltose regulon positive regulatory protein
MRIPIGSSEWLEWAIAPENTRFRYFHASGNYTVRRETKVRGGFYWVGYRRIDGTLHKRYLGKADAMTVEKLNQAAVDFGLMSQDTTFEKQGRNANG